MQLRVPAGVSRPLPPKAATRLERLGYDKTVTRSKIVAECGSARAGDQFIHTWSARGLLVPAKWGSYYVPSERAAGVALSTRLAHHARLVSWALCPARSLGFLRRPGFMGPVLWELTDLSISHPCPVLPLSPTDPRIPPTVPQLQAFAVDLGWPLEPLEILVGNLATIRGFSIQRADVAWILSLNMDARVRAAGSELLRHLPAKERSRALDIRRLANFPAFVPSRSRSLLPMVGPPSQFRIFAPRWYMQPHLRALQAEVRRPAHG
jgi:hypothetical protein